MGDTLIYVAGPLFSEHERDYKMRMVEEICKRTGLDPEEDFFVPHRDIGDVGVSTTQDEAFKIDIEKVKESDIVIALLDGPDIDSGTAAEMGYAFSRNKKIFGLLTDFRAYRDGGIRTNNIIWGMCERGETIYRDLPTMAEDVAEYMRKDGMV